MCYNFCIFIFRLIAIFMNIIIKIFLTVEICFVAGV